ncbi:F8A5.1 protein [Striga asiatica]|uniref:F8A5.1 protein n=1 Tax=Striga asiatica TaxID=4170 RepID=A0A5A7Q6F2_STRAF|nr:F8A5.1 protein [Striga asiatica]
MEVNSLDQLCKFVISDTGIGSTLEEFQVLKYQNDSICSSKWGGILCIASTSISDEEIHHLKFDLNEVVSSRRLVRVTSASKNVSFSVCEETDDIITMLSSFIQKILLLRAPKIAVELIVESGCKSKPGNIILQNPCGTLSMHATNIDYLKLGLRDYVSKHGNRLAEACHSCFSAGKNLKVGSGVACSRGNQQSGRQVMEVVIVISETSMPDEPSCFRSHGRKSEVLYFRDFTPCSISQPSLDALTSIEWKNYGLVLKSVGDEDGVTLLEWENFPSCSRIDIVLHNHCKQLTTLPCPENNQIDRLLTRKAVKLALTELKKKNAGLLLSERAVKICKYAPDLAKTISGLIMSSHDPSFQAECLSLLGLKSEGNEKDAVANCITDKIISVVAANDRKSRSSKETTTLFSDDAHRGLYVPDEECEEGEQGFDYIDL